MNDIIQSLWQETPEGSPMSQDQLTALLEPGVESGSRVLHRYVRTYVLVQLGTLVLGGANLMGYRSNPSMLWIQAAAILAALGFSAYGVHLHGKVRAMELMDDSLEATVRRRLTFYRSHATTWMWLASLSLVTFTFTLNSLVDNTGGEYPINNLPLYLGIQVAMVLTFTVACYLTHEPHLRQLRATLTDLESQVLDESRAVAADQARWKHRRVALTAVLVLLAALGIWLAWRAL